MNLRHFVAGITIALVLTAGSALAGKPPATADQLKKELATALQAQDRDAFLGLFNWDGSNEMVKSNYNRLVEMTLRGPNRDLSVPPHSTNMHWRVSLFPLSPGLDTEQVAYGFHLSYNVTLVGEIQIVGQWDGTNTSWQESLPYGTNHNAYYLAGTRAVKVYEPKTQEKMFLISVALTPGTNAPGPLSFTGTYVYVQNEQPITRTINGSTFGRRVFFGDYIQSCTIQKTADTTCTLKLQIMENGKKIFESKAVGTKDPMVYEKPSP